jgi:tRNA 2-thiouridine synthesizing protein D
MLRLTCIFDEVFFMKFGILIKQGPFTHQASDTAYRFSVAALAKGHEIYRVFFYNDGVYNSNKLSEPQTDDRNLVSLWKELAAEHDLDLVVCIAAALRRGMKEEILEDGFRISGLGQLVEAGIEADRTIVFGD